MDEIRRQVSIARGRLLLQQFCNAIVWTLFIGLLVCAAALAVPKIWVLNLDEPSWMWGWLGGTLGAAVVAALLWTYLVRRQTIEAAIEIDRRYGLKERVTSALSLSPDEIDSEAGQALLDDARRRIERIDVREHFGVSANWRAFLPLAPAIAVFVLAMFVADATNPQAVQAAQAELATRQQIKKSTDQLKKKLQEKRKQAIAKGLKDAEVVFDKLHRELNKLDSKDKLSRKDALIKLNDLKKELQDRKRKLGNSAQMRKKLSQFKDLQPGPADKMAKAIKDGNFKKAVEELKKLQDQLQKNQLDDKQKEQLTKQMEQMQQQLQKMADAHQQAKDQLDGRIEQLKKAGNLAEAGKLQRQLDQLQQQDAQADRMRKMAQNLANGQQSLKQGNGKQAAQQLAEAADQLQQMQQELDQLESLDPQTLDEMIDQIAQARRAMDCKQCQGKGCGT